MSEDEAPPRAKDRTLVPAEEPTDRWLLPAVWIIIVVAVVCFAAMLIV
jgi:hypothetical protein